MKTFVSVAAVLAAVLAAPAAAQRVEKYTPLPNGSSYVIVNDDTGSYGNGRREVPVQVVAHTWKGQAVQAYRNPDGSMLAVLPTGNWLGMSNAEGKPTLTWDPPVGYEWPLEVGRSWKRTTNVTFHLQDRTVPVESQQTVEAYEEVTVPAGTYSTFRVRSSNSLGDSSLIWFSPQLGLFVKGEQQRAENHPAGAGQRKFELKSIDLAR